VSKFEIKYNAGSEVKSLVLDAADEASAGKAFKAAHQGISTDDVISVRRFDHYRQKYGVADFICVLIALGGWILLVLGVIGVIAGVMTAQSLFDAAHGGDPGKQMFMAVAIGGAYLSLVIAIIGLLMVAVGQHLHATTDAANSLGEILVILKASVATSTSALMRSSIATASPEPTTRISQQVPARKACSACGATAVDATSAFCAECGAKL